MPVARLPDRAVIKVSGPQAAGFLDGLVTCDLDVAGDGLPKFGALLTPQGKILFDFIAHRTRDADGPAYFLDTPAANAADFAKRLGFYKLRAKVAVADLSAELAVLAGWDADPIPAEAGLVGPDPRLPRLGWRAIVAAGDAAEFADADARAWHAHRIACGVPEGGRDYLFAQTFPHEALMDQLGGVDFHKGCYVGQEVVSRMQHRGTARTRILPARYADALAPETGVDVTAGEKTIGTTGGAAGGTGLVMVRLDRVADAMEAGVALSAGGRPLTLARPDWIRFETPGVATPLTES